MVTLNLTVAASAEKGTSSDAMDLAIYKKTFVLCSGLRHCSHWPICRPRVGADQSASVNTYVKQLSAVVWNEFTNFYNCRQLFKTLIPRLRQWSVHPSRFTGNVWLATRYTTADSVVYIVGLSTVVK